MIQGRLELLDTLAFVPIAPAPVTRRVPARQFRFSEAQTQAVIDAYRAGATMASLAEQYGVKRQTVSELLKREGVATRARRAMSQAEIDKAVQLYTGGLSLQKIGDQLGWDHTTVYRHLRSVAS